MSYSDENKTPYIEEYASAVESGEIIACKEQKQLVAMVRRVLSDGSAWVNHEQLEKYMSYQKYFPFELYPWEKFVFALHNCTYRPDGRPRFPDLFAYMGRGAGKNGYLSFEDFCLLTETNGIPNYDIDICATTEDQAKTSFDEVYAVLENPEHSKKFRRNFKWTKTEILNRKTGSKIRFRTNNAKSKDGLRSGKVDFDEIHAYENWDNINVFTTGLGKKPHPRRTYITTDGEVRDAPLDQLKEQAWKILSGEMEDNGFLPFMCRLDDESEVHDEAMWSKANPSLIYKPDLLDQMRREYVTYKEDPVKNSSFMSKRMNMPQDRKDIMFTSWENILKTNRPVPDLEGKTCVCGIDYTRTTDFMSAVLVFRVGEQYYAIHHSWFCSQSRDKGRIKIPLDEMERRGILTIVDDVEVRPELVAEWLQAMRYKYNIVKVAADSYRWSLLRRALESVGFCAEYGDVKMVRPSDIMYAQTKISSVFARGLVAWGDDPMMRWYTNNTKLEPAPNNNYKFGKIDPEKRKTDGFMAFVHAMTVEDELPEEVDADIILEPIIL